MRRRVALVVVVLATASACELPDFGAPEGASKQGQEIFELWQGSVAAALAVGALVWALILFAVFRFRRRKGDDGVPSQKQYNITLEVIYTLLPLVVVAGLFYFTVQTQTEVTKIAANPAVQVEVTAFQWGWRFSYSGSEVVVESQGDQLPTLTLPVGQTTRITLQSVDVVHSFYVPDFLYKRDAVPGIVNTFDFDPVRTGTILGRCAEFCGLRHADMLFEVSVVTPEEFQRWLATEGAARTTTTSAPTTSTTTTIAPPPGGAVP